MKNTSTKFLLAALFAMPVIFVSCGEDIKRTPAKTYMPDMYYSRAYETYTSTEYLKEQGINFNAEVPKGAVKRGDMLPAYDIPNTPEGYAAAAKTLNPLPALTEQEATEAERLYLINCGICHGDKLDGNGPLYKGGEGPYPAKPATLVGDAKYESMAAGTMFHAITYGKNLMGSYAAQLTTKQRWMVIHYIKSKQAKK